MIGNRQHTTNQLSQLLSRKLDGGKKGTKPRLSTNKKNFGTIIEKSENLTKAVFKSWNSDKNRRNCQA